MMKILVILFWILIGQRLNRESQLVDLVVIAAERIELDVELSYRMDKIACDFVLLSSEESQPLRQGSDRFCVLSSEELFLFDVRRYLILESYSFDEDRALLIISLVETMSKTSKERSTRIEFRFEKDAKEVWRLVP